MNNDCPERTQACNRMSLFQTKLSNDLAKEAISMNQGVGLIQAGPYENPGCFHRWSRWNSSSCSGDGLSK